MSFDAAAFDAAIGIALDHCDGAPQRLLDAMRYAMRGGKRVRARLVYAAGVLAGATPAHCMAPALAVELVHAYSLVHDDLPDMDNDALRRGQPTVHVAFDPATAILAGDALQALAFEVLVSSQFAAPSVEARLRWVQSLTRNSGAAGMAGGQQLDLAAEHQVLEEAALETLHRLKSGALIQSALAMGLAAGAPTLACTQAVLSAGRALGLAFQVQDDVLDVTGTAESLGKTPGKDVESGKNTYVALLGLAPARAYAERLFDEAEAALAAHPAQALTHIIAMLRGREA